MKVNEEGGLCTERMSSVCRTVFEVFVFICV